MRSLKAFCLTILHLVRRVCLFPKMLADAVNKKRQQTIVSEDEAERLDRLRNPSKYLGR